MLELPCFGQSHDSGASGRAPRASADFDTDSEPSGQVHLLESEVYAEDLSATWHDQQAGIADWRVCLVSGSHLRNPDDGTGTSLMVCVCARARVRVCVCACVRVRVCVRASRFTLSLLFSYQTDKSSR